MGAAGRWTVFALGAIAFFLSFFHRVAPAAIAEDLTRIFHLSGAALGTLAATYFYIYAAMQLPTGILADTLGPRRILTAGAIVAGIGAIVFGAAPSWPVAAAGRALIGLGAAVPFVCLLKLNAAWFHERRFATASGAANIAGISGALAATAPLAWLVTVVSWRALFVMLGIASILLAAATWRIVRDRPEADRPAGSDAAVADGARWHRGLIAVLRNRATWAAFWVTFGMSGSYMSFIGLWIVPYLAHTYGMSAVAASRHASVVLTVFAISVACVTSASDRIGRRRPLIIASAAAYLCCWLVWLSGIVAPGWTYAMCALMGFVTTGFTLTWACAKEANAPRYAGMAIGVANTGGFIAAGLVQPLVGWVLDLASGGGRGYSAADFDYALIVLALFAAIGLTGALFIRETYCRNIAAGSWEGAAAK